MISFTFFCLILLIPFAIFKGGVLSYLVGVNIFAFLLTGYDKRAALKKIERLPERFLHTMCIFGGTIGCVIAMLLFRHKTSKTSFYLPVLGIFLAQILLIIIIIEWGK